MPRTTPEAPEAAEADDMGERPDLGRTPDALGEALTGTGAGSDTRAGSLAGGAATGSDDDPDQAAVDRALAGLDQADSLPGDPSDSDPDVVANTGPAPGESGSGRAAGGRDDDADAATG